MRNILTKEEQKLKQEASRAASEKAYNLVVKIIKWKTGIFEGKQIEDKDLITTEEWERYKNYLEGVSTTDSSEKLTKKLAETFEIINKRGGFKP